VPCSRAFRFRHENLSNAALFVSFPYFLLSLKSRLAPVTGRCFYFYLQHFNPRNSIFLVVVVAGDIPAVDGDSDLHRRLLQLRAEHGRLHCDIAGEFVTFGKRVRYVTLRTVTYLLRSRHRTSKTVNFSC